MIPTLPSTPPRLHLHFAHAYKKRTPHRTNAPTPRTGPSPCNEHAGTAHSSSVSRALSLLCVRLSVCARAPRRGRGAAAMAAGRRLSELLQEQQEPFLVEAAAKVKRLRRGRTGGGGAAGAGCCPVAACRRLLRLCNHGFKKRSVGSSGGIAGLRSALGKVLASNAMRSVLRWESLGGGCFTGVAVGGGDREFRRLSRSAGHSGECDARAMEFEGDDGYECERARWKTADMEVDSSRQLSPVSVLDLHSDDESLVHSLWEDEKPSTSGSSPQSENFHGPTSPCFTYNVHDKARSTMAETEEEDDETVRNQRRCIEEQIWSWERIAGDIAKIPGMVEQDLAQYMQQWRGLEPEVREIGARIETLIFEDMRRETVCDMLASRCTLAPAPPC